MQIELIPRCTRCADGGTVTIITLDASGMFQPLPDGWDLGIQVYQCKCGWTGPVKGPPTAPRLSRRSITLQQRLSKTSAQNNPASFLPTGS